MNRRYLVTGGAGFIGSHLVDSLIQDGDEVAVVDNLQSGYRIQVNPKAHFDNIDITDFPKFSNLVKSFSPHGIFHLAAIARTPWCLWEPLLAAHTNGYGTVCVYEAARLAMVPRVVAASSNVIYAANTPYRATKEQVNQWAKVYRETYGQEVQTLVFSNVYGPRQSEEGPAPNVFAAFRKSKRENGVILVTGDGTQTRQFTHVYDIVRGIYMAMRMPSESVGSPIDLCHPRSWSMNEVCELWGAKIEYIPERPGDVKDIRQEPDEAIKRLGWKALINLEHGIEDVK